MIEIQQVKIDKIDKLPDFSLWITNVINNEGFKVGDINYIFCDDSYLYDMNIKYLKHDTLTDIITFPLSSNSNIISGEIYISIDRVKENSLMFKTAFEKELSRVVVHGVLHLLGYDDHSEEDILEMRKKEDYYLSLLP